jgi:hypothetical protein
MKKPRILTWEELLKIEEKHPFSAGNLLSLRSFTSAGKLQYKASKKARARRRQLAAA